METTEQWKDIAGYEGLYQVSNLGRVKSLERIVKHSRGGDKVLKEKVMSPKKDPSGYLRIGLHKNGKQSWFTVHRLVAQAFILNSENKPCVNHIDGDKLNNHVDNLEWVTYSENEKHAYDTGLKTAVKGKDHANSKKVIDTKTGVIYDSAKAAAAEFGLNCSTMRQYLNGSSPNKTTLKYLDFI